jgi:hypothetical protein
MSIAMHRSQILLEPEQHAALAEIANEENRSISDIVREIVRDWLRNQEGDALQQQRRQALEGLARLRLEIQEERGIYQGDLIEEMRRERDADFDRVWRGEA